MMDEEEELEDELGELDIKEDLGEEDSDVTPTNTPIPSTPPTIVYLPQSSNTSGFFDGDFTRFSSSSDYDMRSDSSLSWGEDEFEGEATRIVNALFNQLDQLIYAGDSSVHSAKFPMLRMLKNRENKKRLKDASNKKQEKVLQPHSYPLQNSLPCSEGFEDEDSCSSSSLGRKSIDISPPSESLVTEIKEWVSNFPHLRVNGLGIHVLHYEQIESKLLEANSNMKSSSVSKNSSEEVLASDGDYENKLQFLSLKPELYKEKKEKRSRGPPSRICSGSMDPDLLKEHVLIRLFDHLWPITSQTIEPLLRQYAQFLISRSVQCSSISRGSSTHGNRELPYIPSLESRKGGLPRSLESLDLNDKRSTLSNSRPSSAMYRLPNKVPSKNIHDEDLGVVLHISCKPLQFAEERSKSASRTRDLSARSRSSLPSLPSLGPWHRPVSSKSGNHLLTPMPTADQRPVSTSSFTRLRYNDKFSKLNRTTTIEEGGDKDNDSEMKPGNLSPTWSRHNSFLPQIYDSQSNSMKKNLNTGSSSSGTLNIYGKSLSARSRICKSDLESGGKYSNAEPFVSWIVSKVEEQSNRVDSVVLQHSARNRHNSLVLDKTKRPPRSHP